MASINIRQHTENGYYVVMEATDNIYKVEVCPCNEKTNMCGYPVHSITYSLNDEKKAKATFNRYVRKYCKGK